MEVIHIYHTNDLHSHFKDWPRIVTLLKERKAWHENAGDNVFIFDIGDHIDRSHPLTDATFGQSNVALLNSAKYDAVTIGNNEGITLPRQSLNSLYDKATFPVIVANIYNKDGSRPRWAKPYDIFTTKSGTRLGVIGLTANFSTFYEELDWLVTDPLEELAKQVKELNHQVDIIILLSHLGLRIDEKIAADCYNIDLILGGHTHHILHDGKLINETLLCCAGKYGNYVGHVELKISKERKSIVDKKAWLYDTNKLPQLDDENKMITNLFMMGEEMLQTEVTILRSRQSEKMIAATLCEALREWCETDCSLLNEGLILEPLSVGRVTKFDLLRICPHPINPTVLNVTGIELEKIIKHSQSLKWHDFQMFGFGFRGSLIGQFLYDQIVFNDGNIFINNKKLDYEKSYKVALPDMFAFGNFFPEISSIKNKKFLLPEFLRDILQWKLERNG